MTDRFLELANDPRAQRIMKAVGVPVPPALERGAGGWSELPLGGRKVALGSVRSSGFLVSLGGVLLDAGAKLLVDEGAEWASALEEHVARVGRPLGGIDEGGRALAHALVFDATGIEDTGGLRALYDFFHPIVRRVAKGGRVLVLGRPVSEAESASAAAASAALEGFVRSIAKEVGRKGATAQLLYVATGAADAMAGPVRFFLSPHSAYVSGQPLTVTGQVRPAPGPWAKSLEGKVALVTGAARGIGAATARRLAQEGARVVCLDLPSDGDALGRIAEEVGGVALGCDLTADGAAGAIVEALRDLGGVYAVVHNAGITRDKTLARMKESHWDLCVDVNLRAIERVTAALVDEGVLDEGGKVVCLSSVAGIAGNVGQTNYSSAKSGLLGFVSHVAPALAGAGVTINAIAPGFIETRLTDAIPVATREVGRRLNNLSQGGLPIDVAEAITFLCMPCSSGVTGQVLRVCGGMMMGA